MVIVAASVAAVAVVLAVWAGAPADPTGRTLHVSAGAGSGGDGTGARPYGRIDDALARAEPANRILVGPGVYPPFATRSAGTPEAPIRIIGTDARIVGPGDGRVVEVVHDYVSLESLDISGGDVLVRVAGADGVRLIASALHDAGSECVRLRDGASDIEIAGNRIERCGTRDFDLEADHKNGEGVYIGVAPEQLDDDPGALAPAEGIRVLDNDISVPAECVDIKEGVRGTLVEGNRCHGGKDPEGAGFTSRGDETTFRDNVSTDQVGAGIRLGGDEADQGVRNVVVGNRLMGNDGYGLKVERFPQGLICGNEVSDNGSGATNGEVDPSLPCPR
jgi:hypothetical protein